MPSTAQPARPDVELKKNKTALLRGDAFGEYFHMGAARVLKPRYEGTLLYVDIKPRLDVLAKLIRDNNGLTKKAATDFQTKFKEWEAGCEDTVQLKQRLRLLQQPASPKIKLASYGCNLREPQVEVVTNNTAPLLPPPDFEPVIQPYGTYIVKGETWGRRKKDGFAEINATPVVAEAFSKGKDECEALPGEDSGGMARFPASRRRGQSAGARVCKNGDEGRVPEAEDCDLVAAAAA